MSTLSNSYIIEYTDFIRNKFLEWIGINFNLKPEHGVYVFNGGILNYCLDYYIISARCIISKHYRYLQHSDLPTMWGATALKTRGKEGSDWTNEFDSTIVLLTYIPDFKAPPNILSYDVLPELGDFRGEDPRIYRRADGNIYLSVVAGHNPCDLGAPNAKLCAYVSEYPLIVSHRYTTSGNVFLLKIHKEIRRKVCQSELSQSNEVLIFSKNLSNWVYRGVNYVTDFKPKYTVYQQDETEVCIPLQVDENVFYKNLKKCFEFKVNRYINGDLLKIQLVDVAGTTPSIEINPEMKSKYFPGVNHPIYAGVAHIRIRFKYFLENDERFNFIVNYLSRKEGNLYSDIISLFRTSRERFKNGDIYAHDDAYLMMMYFFNPDIDERGNRGNIEFISDIFYPLSRTIQTRQMSNFLLVFPTGLMMYGDEIVISYGEGDVFQRILVTNLETLGLRLSKDYSSLQLKSIDAIILNKEAEIPKEELIQTLTLV